MYTKAPHKIPGRVRAPCYLAEVTLRVTPGSDLAWVRSSIEAACQRTWGGRGSPQVLSVAYLPEAGLLLFVIKSAKREDVVRLFDIANLPPARVLDLIMVGVKPPERRPGRSAATPVPPSEQLQPSN